MGSDPIFTPTLSVLLGLGCPGLIECKAENRTRLSHGSLDKYGGDSNAGTITGDTIQLFSHGGFIGAIRVAYLLIPFVFALRSSLSAFLETDSLIETIIDRCIEIDKEHLKGVLPGPCVFNELIKRVLNAIVSGDDPHLAAPDQKSKSRSEERRVGKE